MDQHTPGPWEKSMRTYEISGVKYRAVRKGLNEIALVTEQLEQYDNFSLITAAPDLLAQLKSLVQWIEDNFVGEESGPDTTNAYIAIGKAEAE